MSTCVSLDEVVGDHAAFAAELYDVGSDAAVMSRHRCPHGHILSRMACMSFAVLPWISRGVCPAASTVSLLQRYQDLDSDHSSMLVMRGMADMFAWLGARDVDTKLGNQAVIEHMEKYTQRYRCHVCHPSEFACSFLELASALAMGSVCVLEAKSLVDGVGNLVPGALAADAYLRSQHSDLKAFVARLIEHGDHRHIWKRDATYK